jgi:hypothetical protein
MSDECTNADQSPVSIPDIPYPQFSEGCFNALPTQLPLHDSTLRLCDAVLVSHYVSGKATGQLAKLLVGRRDK